MIHQLKLEPNPIEMIKDHHMLTFVTALINWGNEYGIKGERVKGVYINEDDTIEVITKSVQD